MRRLQAGGTECPVPVPTKLTNEDMVFLPLPSLRGGHVRLAVRVLTWVEGRTMSDVGSDEVRLELAGAFLGGLSRSLEGFDHAAAHREHSWDLARSLDLRGFTPCISDKRRRKVVESILNAFERELLPVAAEGYLEMGVIMGDYNDANVIFRPNEASDAGVASPEWKVGGVIDFGDMVYTWRINELAIAMAYSMVSSWATADNERHCVDAAACVLRGFAATYRVGPTELALLRILTACRLACSYTMGMYVWVLGGWISTGHGLVGIGRV
mmetsp:Transcript_64551/g.179095  ORF Transcript_64551/g.179095 Transcript_64551/m.179095 type:complete len:269 (+) Transcript_64551:475-1281(+)